MKYFLILLLTLTFNIHAQAGLAFPYKVVTVDCKSETESLKLIWDFSKSPHVGQILVNGQDESAGTIMYGDSESDLTTYYKDGIFAISLGPADNKKQVIKDVEIYGQSLRMVCNKSSRWRITKSE